MRVIRVSRETIRELRFTRDGAAMVALEGNRGGFTGVSRHSLFDDQVVHHELTSAVVSLSNDGATLALAGPNDQLSIFFVDDLAIRGNYQHYREWNCCSVSINPVNDRVYCIDQAFSVVECVEFCNENADVRWNIGVGRFRERIDPETRTLAIQRDGRLLAIPGSTAVSLRLAKSGEEVARWPIDAGPTRAEFSPDGQQLVLASGSYARIHDTMTGKQRQALIGHRSKVTCLAFSPDGRILGTGSRDRTVRFWDFATGKLLHTYAWPTGPVYSLAFAPDGLTAAAGGESGDIVIWDVEG